MPSLEETQNKILDSIFSSKASLDFIRANGSIKAEERLGVHQDTIFENFVGSLEIIYPGIWCLIGSDCARGVALAYGHDFVNITDRSNINGFGENFPDFLSHFPSTKHLEYLPDYAVLEWLRSRSYEAPNQKTISQEKFSEALNGNLEAAKVEFNHSVFFLRSNWPLDKIQELLDCHRTKLDIFHEECFVLVCRVQAVIKTLFLGKEQWQFLFALKNKKTLGQALEELVVFDDSDSQITTIMSLLIANEMIARINI